MWVITEQSQVRFRQYLDILKKERKKWKKRNDKIRDGYGGKWLAVMLALKELRLAFSLRNDIDRQTLNNRAEGGLNETKKEEAYINCINWLNYRTLHT